MAGKFVSPKAKESLMTDILVKLFVKDYKDVEKVSVRTAYGVLASGVGIFCNVLLTIAKMVIGILLHSVSVTADAFNNLSDAGSSIIGMIGVKMAEKPADKEHPFGHGRLEYIAALIVSFLVIEVGFTFFKNAIVKIREPEELKFSLVSILILVLSIGVKLWLAMFNRKLGEKISSQRCDHDSSDDPVGCILADYRDQYRWLCRTWCFTGRYVGRIWDCEGYA